MKIKTPLHSNKNKSNKSTGSKTNNYINLLVKIKTNNLKKRLSNKRANNKSFKRKLQLKKRKGTKQLVKWVKD